MSRERYEVGGRVVEAEVQLRADAVHVAGDGADLAVTARALGEGRWLLRGPGGPVEAVVVGDSVCIQGRVRRVRRAPPAAAAPPPVVTPPMPGVVGRVLVALGDEVKARQALVTVVAMKMELTLRAPKDGVVRAIRVAAGDKVAPGDVLVEVA